MAPLSLWKSFVVTTDHESLKYFCDQQDLKGRKARWADLIQDFDFSIRYRKGSMNIVDDALSRIREVNMLNFTEITSDLYDHLRGKYPDDSHLQNIGPSVESGIDITTTSMDPSTLLTVCSTVMGRSVFQICLRSKREFFLSAMMYPKQGILEYIVTRSHLHSILLA